MTAYVPCGISIGRIELIGQYWDVDEHGDVDDNADPCGRSLYYSMENNNSLKGKTGI